MAGKLYLTGAFALAGTSVAVGSILSAKLGSFTITAVSTGIALVTLLPFYAAKTLRAIRQMQKRDAAMICLQALLGIFLFRMFLLLGVQRTSTADAGILTGTAPAITAVMAYFILKERPGGFTALGIIAAVLGILCLQGDSLFALQFSGQNLLGNTLILGAATSESTFNILSRKQKADENSRHFVPIHSVVQALMVCTVTFVLSLVPALSERPLAALPALGFIEWFLLLWYGLFVTALAFAFFYAGAKRCGAFTIAAFSGMMPLTSLLLSMLVLRETTTALQWIGGALIILSMMMIGRKNRRIRC